jgi:general secretion pathway protein D
LGSSFDFAVQAIATDGNANVISRPRIQTSHAIPGNIFVGETRPYVTGFSDYGGLGAGFSTRSTVQERTIGLTLSVTPFITPEGFVVMEIQQQFDRFTESVIVEGNPYPLVDSRMADSVLTVRNGDLIMLGGLIRDSRSKGKSGVPILKDIPGLGALFRSTAQGSQRTELIILMKATVLETPEQAAFLAAEERATLPGVREAEMFQEREVEKRNKKVNKRAREYDRRGY